MAGSPELCRDNLLIPEVLVNLQLGEDDPGNPPDILFFELSSMGAMSFEALFWILVIHVVASFARSNMAS